jgi:hypothetical protein
MPSSAYPLLITSAIDPPEGIPFLSMTNSVKRKFLTKSAFYFWIAKGFRHIVIADATNSLLLTESELDELAPMGVVIEQIRYNQNSARTVAKGKGYGEGKLIEHALENSALLGNSSHFYKSTGKTYVRNYSAIDSLIKKEGFSTLIWRHTDAGDLSKPWADARFYFTSIDFAVAHLIPSYLESDDKVSACEFHIHQNLNRTCQSITALRPLVCGFSGGADAEYFDESMGYLDYNYPCWIQK